MWRTGIALLGTAFLAGCLAAPAPSDDPSLLRNPTVPLSIISRGGADAMQGAWHVRSSSRGYGDIHSLTFNTTAPPHTVEFQVESCDTSGNCEALTDGWLAKPLAQNRWELTSETTETGMELWVIWIDDGFRTAAIGSPDSDMAFILDRKASGGADRVKAASEVLDFNGYNMSALVTR